MMDTRQPMTLEDFALALDAHEQACQERHSGIMKRHRGVIPQFKILQWMLGGLWATMIAGFGLLVSLLLA